MLVKWISFLFYLGCLWILVQKLWDRAAILNGIIENGDEIHSHQLNHSEIMQGAVKGFKDPFVTLCIFIQDNKRIFLLDLWFTKPLQLYTLAPLILQEPIWRLSDLCFHLSTLWCVAGGISISSYIWPKVLSVPTEAPRYICKLAFTSNWKMYLEPTEALSYVCKQQCGVKGWFIYECYLLCCYAATFKLWIMKDCLKVKFIQNFDNCICDHKSLIEDE